MKIKYRWIATIALLQGCAGYDSVLFTTRSNIGLDVDTAPARSEISIDRSELIIAPTFEKGKTIPAEASFRSKSNPFSNFFFGADSTFATGEAALMLTALYGDPDAFLVSNNTQIATMPFGKNHAGSVVTTNDNKNTYVGFKEYNGLVLDHHPSVEKIKFWSVFKIWNVWPGGNPYPEKKIEKIPLPDPGLVRPVVFGTDTSLGLSIKWTASAAPSAIKLGFNRKETAFAPVMIATNTTSGTTNFNVNMPSLFASLQSNITVSNKTSKVDWLQYFATGEAAENLTLRRDVRIAMIKEANPASLIIQQEIKKEREKLDAINKGLNQAKSDGDFKSDLYKVIDTDKQDKIKAYYDTHRGDLPETTDYETAVDNLHTLFSDNAKFKAFKTWYQNTISKE